jgi:hypothetical protein
MYYLIFLIPVDTLVAMYFFPGDEGMITWYSSVSGDGGLVFF